MKKNMSLTDRGIRFILLISIVILYFLEYLQGAFGIFAMIVAGIFFITSLIGYCPLYQLIGIKTCKDTKSTSEKSSEA